MLLVSRAPVTGGAVLGVEEEAEVEEGVGEAAKAEEEGEVAKSEEEGEVAKVEVERFVSEHGQYWMIIPCAALVSRPADCRHGHDTQVSTQSVVGANINISGCRLGVAARMQ